MCPGPQHGGSYEYSQGLKASGLKTRRAFEEKISNLYRYLHTAYFQPVLIIPGVTLLLFLFLLCSKYQSLPCFEQYLAIADCISAMQDMRSQTPNVFGLTGPLPSIDQLVFVFDLFEVSGDVQGLIEFIAHTVIPDEDTAVPQAPPTSSIDSQPSKAIVTIAMLRHYHTCLSLMPDILARIFKG